MFWQWVESHQGPLTAPHSRRIVPEEVDLGGIMDQHAVEVVIRGGNFSKQDIQDLLQAIRDCEQGKFPDKDISILVHAPSLNAEESTEIIKGVRPHFVELLTVAKTKEGGTKILGGSGEVVMEFPQRMQE